MRTVIAQVARNRSLSRLLAAYFAVVLAEYGQWIALLVYAYERGGATAAGLIAIVQLVPSIFLAPIISAHGVRYGAVRLLVCSYLTEAVMLAACAAAILLHAPLALVYAAAIGCTVPLGVSRPLHSVLMPLVVRRPDELTAANVATTWCDGLGTLLGPAVAGVLITVDGPGLACAGLAAICALTPVLASVRPLRASAEDGDEEEGNGFSDLLAAMRAIASRPSTRALMAYPVGAATIEGAIDLLVVILAVRILAVGPGASGYLSAAFGAGGLLGGVAAVLLIGRRLALPLAAAAMVGGIALALLSLASTVLVAVVLLVLVGASRAVQTVAAQTLLQRTTPLDVIVCVFALIESVHDAGLALGALLVPILVGLGGPDAAFIGVAAVAPLVVAFTARRMLRIDEDASIPVVEMGQLRNLAIFASLPAAPLETLAREAEHETVAAGARIITEGEEGDRYYAITSGGVLVTQEGQEIRRLSVGDGFGEIALLYAVTRTATVIATSETGLLCVGRDSFLTALHASAHVQAAASRIASSLLAEPAL